MQEDFKIRPPDEGDTPLAKSYQPHVGDLEPPEPPEFETSGRQGKNKLAVAKQYKDDDVETRDVAEFLSEMGDMELFNMYAGHFLNEEARMRWELGKVSPAEKRLWVAQRRRMIVRLWSHGWTPKELAIGFGVSEDTIIRDLAALRKAYAGSANRNWAVLVEERLLQLDFDIQDFRRIRDTLAQNGDLNGLLAVQNTVMSLEARRDKILGLDKAAASQYSEKQEVVVELSFGDPSIHPRHVDVIDVTPEPKALDAENV